MPFATEVFWHQVDQYRQKIEAKRKELDLAIAERVTQMGRRKFSEDELKDIFSNRINKSQLKTILEKYMSPDSKLKQAQEDLRRAERAVQEARDELAQEEKVNSVEGDIVPRTGLSLEGLEAFLDARRRDREAHMKKVSVTLKVGLDEILGTDPLCLSTLRNWLRPIRTAQGCEVIVRVIASPLYSSRIGALPGFVRGSRYGWYRAEPDEIGAVENFRFFVPDQERLKGGDVLFNEYGEIRWVKVNVKSVSLISECGGDVNEFGSLEELEDHVAHPEKREQRMAYTHEKPGA